MKVHWSLSAPSDAALEALGSTLATLPAGECRARLCRGLDFERELRKNWTEPAYAPHVGSFELPLTAPAAYTGDGADPGMEMSAEAKALGDHLEATLYALAQQRREAAWPDPVADEVHAALARLVIVVGSAFRRDAPVAAEPGVTLH